MPNVDNDEDLVAADAAAAQARVRAHKVWGSNAPAPDEADLDAIARWTCGGPSSGEG